MTYLQAIDYLYNSLPMFQKVGAAAYNKDLSRTIAFCTALGNPHKKFKSVHIAGTNGKGTSAHTLSAVLQSAGYKTGLYTSPHLKSFTERIRIDGIEIDKKFVVDFVIENRELLEKIKPSFFETTVAMAFDHFAKHKVDIAIIEVGMGGRLDSTNIITPEVCLITQIGLDHQQFLGESLAEIALEKAGIIKSGVPVVIGDDHGILESAFIEKASNMNAPITFATAIKIEFQNNRKVKLLSGSLINTELQLSILSTYYLKNIPGIIGVIEELIKAGWQINDAAVQQGFASVQQLTGLKGRWQILSDSPLTICDVCHNTDGIRAIVDQIIKTAHNRLHFVYGTVNDKKIDDILTLLPKSAHYYFTQAKIPRALDASELAEKASNFGLKGESYPDVNQAIASAKSNANNNDMIFIGGSTFIVAEITEL
ncbi:MAG: folylpolyglutamate synthase/dihydrofolate synthase family protein [Cyclobacteriaceae bacterium]